VKHIYRILLKICGWKINIPFREPSKSVICLAPHTSNMDFVIGQLGLRASGRKTSFLMKKFWFFFPLKYIFTAIGGIAVDRTKHNSLTDRMVDMFNSNEKFHLAITPEGSRKAVEEWKTGFYYIALKASVPVELAYIDYKKKTVGILSVFIPTGNESADLATIKSYYKNVCARYPEKSKLVISG
jgi:1-acyl-sn-glycerol-3-phosphate acyltransferase